MVSLFVKKNVNYFVKKGIEEIYNFSEVVHSTNLSLTSLSSVQTCIHQLIHMLPVYAKNAVNIMIYSKMAQLYPIVILRRVKAKVKTILHLPLSF